MIIPYINKVQPIYPCKKFITTNPKKEKENNKKRHNHKNKKEQNDDTQKDENNTLNLYI